MDEPQQPGPAPSAPPGDGPIGASPSHDPVQATETTLAMALQSMAQAAGLAMLAGPQTQSNARQVAAAAVARVCQGLVEINFTAPGR